MSDDQFRPDAQEKREAHEKHAAAEAAVSQVRDGMIVGLGSGTTASIALQILGESVRKGLRILGIPTSERTAEQARQLGIPLTDFAAHSQIDLTIDGADEVELDTLNLIKGLGGALLREKLVASVSRRLLIIVDEGKIVDTLGSRSPLPVEVIPFGWQITARKLHELGAMPKLRQAATGQPFVSDGGHYILDCSFDDLDKRSVTRTFPGLAADLDHIVGVVEHGLFLNMAPTVYVGDGAGVRILRPRN